MALRNIRKEGDEILSKHCRPVTDFNDRLHELLDDMAETMLAGRWWCWKPIRPRARNM